MKSLNTLIKVHTSELDELRQRIVQCEEQREQLIEYHDKMEDELELEHAIAASNPEMGIMFANYRKMIRQRQSLIVKSLKDIAKQLEQLQKDIALKFGEVKKFEILLATKLAEHKKHELALETKQLDDIAVTAYAAKEEA